MSGIVVSSTVVPALRLNEVSVLDRVNYSTKPKSHRFVDAALALARTACGKPVLVPFISRSKEVVLIPVDQKPANVFFRIIAGILALATLPITFFFMVIKYCLMDAQEKSLARLFSESKPILPPLRIHPPSPGGTAPSSNIPPLVAAAITQAAVEGQKELTQKKLPSRGPIVIVSPPPAPSLPSKVSAPAAAVARSIVVTASGSEEVQFDENGELVPVRHSSGRLPLVPPSNTRLAIYQYLRHHNVPMGAVDEPTFKLLEKMPQAQLRTQLEGIVARSRNPVAPASASSPSRPTTIAPPAALPALRTSATVAGRTPSIRRSLRESLVFNSRTGELEPRTLAPAPVRGTQVFEPVSGALMPKEQADKRANIHAYLKHRKIPADRITEAQFQELDVLPTRLAIARLKEMLAN